MFLFVLESTTLSVSGFVKMGVCHEALKMSSSAK